MKLFLDDMRDPSECAKYMHVRIGKLNPIYLEGEWYIVRNFDQFVKAVTSYYNDITHISFDHDLADEHYTPEEHWETIEKSRAWQEKQEYKEKTGYECAKWMKNFYRENNLKRPVMFVHSMNPVGTENIINLFK